MQLIWPIFRPKKDQNEYAYFLFKGIITNLPLSFEIKYFLDCKNILSVSFFRTSFSEKKKDLTETKMQKRLI